MALRTGLILSLMVAAAGCQSDKFNFNLETRKISVNTIPSGAHVYQVEPIDGSKVFLGKTPLKDQSVAVMTGATVHNVSMQTAHQLFSQIEMVRVVIEKAGYQTYYGNLSTERDGKVAAHTIEMQEQ